MLTTIVHHHLTLTPSNESWCYADPPTPRWHTPRTLVQTQALRWTPSSTPNRTSARLHVCTYRYQVPCSFFARETAPASLLAVRAQLWSWRRGGRDLQLLAGRRFVDCCSVWASTGEGWQDIAPSQQAADGPEGEEGGRREGRTRSVRSREGGGRPELSGAMLWREEAAAGPGQALGRWPSCFFPLSFAAPSTS